MTATCNVWIIRPNHDALCDSSNVGVQAMKFLQQAVGLRGYAQREPLSEYKLEGYGLFLEMMARIRRNAIYNVYVFQPDQVKQQQPQQEKQDPAPAAVEAVAASAE